MQPTALMMLQRKNSIRRYGCEEVYCSPVNVPFSWEYKPGLSKVARQRSKKANNTAQSALSPPPCSLTGPYKQEDPPLILCAATVQMKENHHHHHHRKEDDPFLKAYKNCTKSPLIKLSTTSRTRRTRTAAKRSFNWSNITKYMSVLPCYSAHAAC